MNKTRVSLERSILPVGRVPPLQLCPGGRINGDVHGGFSLGVDRLQVHRLVGLPQREHDLEADRDAI